MGGIWLIRLEDLLKKDFEKKVLKRARKILRRK
jgi:hypothetical protein